MQRTTTTWQQIRSGLETATKDAAIILHVYAAVDANTGKSWCPDCQNAFPFVDQLNKQFKILDCPLTKDGYKDHALRKDALFKLEQVPTLYRFDGPDRYTNLLVEAECSNPELLSKFAQ